MAGSAYCFAQVKLATLRIASKCPSGNLTIL
jgi:hypothetical protein